MRSLLIIIGFLLISTFVSAQNNPFITISSQRPAVERLEYSLLNNNFYENNNGSMQFMVADEYFGTSLSYFKKTANRFQYGLNAGIIPMVSNYHATQQFSKDNEQSRLLLFPFWLSLKIRLRTNLEDKLIPYLIGGLGPTLGLDLGSNNGFIDTISYLRGQIGGGGFAGVGFDYLWAEDWAISMDVRYNIFAFNHPLGEDKEFSGFSFYIGFVRAFGL